MAGRRWGGVIVVGTVLSLYAQMGFAASGPVASRGDRIRARLRHPFSAANRREHLAKELYVDVTDPRLPIAVRNAVALVPQLLGTDSQWVGQADIQKVLAWTKAGADGKDSRELRRALGRLPATMSDLYPGTPAQPQHEVAERLATLLTEAQQYATAPPAREYIFGGLDLTRLPTGDHGAKTALKASAKLLNKHFSAETKPGKTLRAEEIMIAGKVLTGLDALESPVVDGALLGTWIDQLATDGIIPARVAHAVDRTALANAINGEETFQNADKRRRLLQHTRDLAALTMGTSGKSNLGIYQTPGGVMIYGQRFDRAYQVPRAVMDNKLPPYAELSNPDQLAAAVKAVGAMDVRFRRSGYQRLYVPREDDQLYLVLSKPGRIKGIHLDHMPLVEFSNGMRGKVVEVVKETGSSWQAAFDPFKSVGEWFARVTRGTAQRKADALAKQMVGGGKATAPTGAGSMIKYLPVAGIFLSAGTFAVFHERLIAAAHWAMSGSGAMWIGGLVTAAGVSSVMKYRLERRDLKGLYNMLGLEVRTKRPLR